MASPTQRPLKNLRTIYDVLYGFIPITEWEEKIINSPFFQRLRWIKQLGFANYIFPGAEHNRFAHVIGVMHSMDQMLRALGLAVADSELFDPRSKNPAAIFHKSMRIAALLHDVGTFPFSHAIEYAYMRQSMSIRVKRYPMVFLLLGLTILSVNCGPAHPLEAEIEETPPETPVTPEDPGPNPKRGRGPAYDLGFQVMAEREGEKTGVLPWKLLEDIPTDFYPSLSRNQIAYGKTLSSGKKPRKLYFVWPNLFGEVRIDGAQLNYQRLDGNNQLIGTYHSFNPSRDTENKRWVVPISEFLRQFHYNESDTHILRIELELADSSKIPLQIKFRTKVVKE